MGSALMSPPGSQDIKVVESYQAEDNINASIQNANLPVSG